MQNLRDSNFTDFAVTFTLLSTKLSSYDCHDSHYANNDRATCVENE